MHVLGFDPHACAAHFRDKRKRRRTEVTGQQMDEMLGRIVTRVVIPRVVMHFRHHYGVAVGGVWKLCPQPIHFPGFNGELSCPAYHELCSAPVVSVLGQCPNSSNFNGDYGEGNCCCLFGYHGHDC